MMRCCEALCESNVLIASPDQAEEARSTRQCDILAGTDTVARRRWTFVFCVVLGSDKTGPAVGHSEAADARTCTRLIVECRRTRRWQTAIRLLQAVLNRGLAFWSAQIQTALPPVSQVSWKHLFTCIVRS